MVRNLKRFDFESCIEGGLLRSMPPSKEKADGSRKAAEKWLEEAQNGLDSGTFNASILSAYLAMFHAARAILFLDGFREKSHYCIARYLEEKYVRSGRLESKWIELLDHYRELRHNSQYDISFLTSEEEADATLKSAKGFVERMGKIIGVAHEKENEPE